MRRLTLLLPPRARIGASGLRQPLLARALARGDPIAPASGDDPLLAHLVEIHPTPWPIAALTRQLDVGDAGDALWIRADPVVLRAELVTARLVGIGGFGLTADDLAALERSLKPLFGDEGFEFSAPNEQRWYLRALGVARLPRFVAPADALGADLRQHLPSGEGAARWIRLGSEAQVLLHGHAVNAARIAAGVAPVNGLWFWGAGVAPTRVVARFDALRSSDSVLRAIALVAGVRADPVESMTSADTFDALIDHRADVDPAAIERDVLAPALAALADRRIETLRLLFAGGDGVALRRAHRWRFWRRTAAPA